MANMYNAIRSWTLDVRNGARRETGRERRFVSGLLWPHISPLQMNINKELLISAACTVCEYVCMQGRHGGAVWTSLPPLLASPPSPPLPQTRISITFCSSCLLLTLTLTSHEFFVFSRLLLFLSLSLAPPPHSLSLSVTVPYVSRRDADADPGTGLVINQSRVT